LKRTVEIDSNGYQIWLARCDCGTEIARASYRFIRGMKTCGCGPQGRPRIANSGAHVNTLYAHTRTSARARDIDFLLTKESFREIVERNCHYCGALPQLKTTHKNLSGQFAFNGIDRVDNNSGYEVSNCVPCCFTCNKAKSALSVDEFREWLRRAFHHFVA
jgi:5-methylcytosine-specific restriction endonuclease McrA